MVQDFLLNKVLKGLEVTKCLNLNKNYIFKTLRRHFSLFFQCLTPLNKHNPMSQQNNAPAHFGAQFTSRIIVIEKHKIFIMLPFRRFRGIALEQFGVCVQ